MRLYCWAARSYLKVYLLVPSNVFPLFSLKVVSSFSLSSLEVTSGHGLYVRKQETGYRFLASHWLSVDKGNGKVCWLFFPIAFPILFSNYYFIAFKEDRGTVSPTITPYQCIAPSTKHFVALSPTSQNP